MLQMIKGVKKCFFMQKQLSCIDAITLQHHYNTNFGISKLLHMTQLKIQNDHFSPYIFSLFLHCELKIFIVYFQYISQTFH